MNFPTFTLLIVEDVMESRELYRNCLLTDSEALPWQVEAVIIIY